MEELESLCFQLGVHFDDLQGETREAKTRELVEYLQNRGRLNDLTATLARERPERYHDTFGQAASPSTPFSNPLNAPQTESITRPLPMWLLGVGALVLVALVTWMIMALRGEPDRESRNSPTTASSGGEIRVIMPGEAKIEQIFVPQGSFQMGADEGEENEQPVHDVTIGAFWLDRTEVTNDQFNAFVNDTGHITTAEAEGGGFLFKGNWDYTEGADWRHPFGPDSDLVGLGGNPVVLVSWSDASEYCEWAGGRLPTEAEWEYAARGQESFVYPWGDTFDGDNLNFCDSNCPFDWSDENADDLYEFTAPVGSYPDGTSWVGAADLAGNVWEWVADWYQDDYYAGSAAENPTGPPQGTYRVLRGGGWSGDDYLARSSARSGDVAPEDRTNFIGFRCAQD